MGGECGPGDCFSRPGTLLSTVRKDCNKASASSAIPIPPPPPNPVPAPCDSFSKGCGGGSVDIIAALTGAAGSGVLLGTNTVGGRQILNVKNGTLDMRWFHSQNFQN